MSSTLSTERRRIEIQQTSDSKWLVQWYCNSEREGSEFFEDSLNLEYFVLGLLGCYTVESPWSDIDFFLEEERIQHNERAATMVE